MSDYQRFVSYLYEYHKDIKGENRGFVKVDSRNRRCQITLRISAFSLPDGTFADIYGFIRRNDSIAGIFLGNLPASNGCVYGSILADPKNLGESGLSLQQLGGMIFFAGNGKIYATQWDDLPILPSAFTVWKPEPDADSEPEEISQTPPEVPDASNPRDSSSEMPADAPAEEMHIASADEESETPKDSLSKRWEQILHTWEVFSPFGDDEIMDCVKITPKDFSSLQRMGWCISPNQFLLYGYYNYRHLLLGRTKTSCIIGVPGIYSAREQFMAELFGYSHFKPSCANMGENVRFGYWYRTLT